MTQAAGSVGTLADGETLRVPRENMVNFAATEGTILARAGWSWGKIIERAGLLVLAALALIISWVLALRAFAWLLERLGG